MADLILNEEKFSLDASNDEILTTFAGWLKESDMYYKTMERSMKRAQDYYEGKQTESDLVVNGKSDVVENRIFEGVETLVPTATANAHQFVVLPGNETEISVSKANKLQKVLERKYESLLMQEKLENVTRMVALYRFGVLKWVWSEALDDVDVVFIDPRLIRIPKLAVDPHNLPYKIEIQDYTRAEMEEFFPKANLDELAMVTPEGSDRRVYRVHEVWGNNAEMVAWISGNTVLEKRANPYWDFAGEEEEEIVMHTTKAGIQKKKKTKKRIYRNHIARPTDPFVFFSAFNVGRTPLAARSLVDIAIPIQDSINVQKRQIINNLKSMGNGQVYVDADSMSKEEADNITNEEGLIIYGDGVASANKVRREAGAPLPSAHFSNLQHSEAVFDNIVGVHSATRGAAQAKTLGQDMLSRQQDFTRIDLLTRILNRGVDRIANGLVQLMKMYYTETHTIKVLGEDGAVEFVKLSQDDIEDHAEIVVKSGNVLPMDQIQMRTEAIQLWQLGALDPVTLFERLRFPNPEKAAERLMAWKSGQLSQDTQSKIAVAREGAAARARASGGPGGAGAPTRGVETPQNVLQRATAGLGGTAPIRGGTPS